MIDVNSFTTDVKDQILGILSAIGTNLVCPVIAAAAVIYCVFQIPQLFKAHRWHVGCFLGVYVEGNHRLVGSGRHRRPLAASVCRCIRNHCLTHCVQKSAAQEVHPWAAAYFFIGD